MSHIEGTTNAARVISLPVAERQGYHTLATALPVPSHNLVQRFVARIDEVLRHTRLVEDADVLGVDPRALVERGEDLLKFDGPQARLLAVLDRKSVV